MICNMFSLVENMLHIISCLVREVWIIHIKLKLRTTAVYRTLRVIDVQLMVSGKLRNDARFTWR